MTPIAATGGRGGHWEWESLYRTLPGVEAFLGVFAGRISAGMREGQSTWCGRSLSLTRRPWQICLALLRLAASGACLDKH
jgi:hypothetical protein